VNSLIGNKKKERIAKAGGKKKEKRKSKNKERKRKVRLG